VAIPSDTLVFPQNVCNILRIGLGVIDPDVVIHNRPLRTTDESEAISVVPIDWDPDDDSHELSRYTAPQPTIQRYTIAVQAMIRDMEEVRGIARHSVLSARVRHTLYRDPNIRLALPETKVSLDNGLTTETLTRHGIAGQQFMNNQNPRGGFIYLSTLEFWFETQLS